MFFLIFRRRSAILTQLFHHKKPSYGPVWVYETTILEVIFCDSHWEIIYLNKWYSGTSEISTPLEIAVGTHFHARHSTKGIPVFLPVGGESSWSLLSSSVYLLSGGTVQPENSYSCVLNVAGQDLGTPKKEISINTNHSYHQRSSC